MVIAICLRAIKNNNVDKIQPNVYVFISYFNIKELYAVIKGFTTIVCK